MEVWKRIANSDNAEVSDHGRVRRNGAEVKLIPDSEGYLRCSVGGKVGRERVHRLVADAFLKKKDGAHFVNHRNNKKHDNRAVNLEWVTPRENSMLAGRDGLLSNATHRMVLCVNEDTGLGRIFYTQADAAKAIGCSDSEVNKALRGKRMTCHRNRLRYLHTEEDIKNAELFVKVNNKLVRVAERLERMANGGFHR